MGQADGRLSLVDVLAAGAALASSPNRLLAHVGRVDIEDAFRVLEVSIASARLREREEHLDGDGGGVGAALALSSWGALHAVPASLTTQQVVAAQVSDLEDGLPQQVVASQVGGLEDGLLQQVLARSPRSGKVIHRAPVYEADVESIKPPNNQHLPVHRP